MEPKKTANADLGKKRFLFFNVGLIVALSTIIFAFTYKSVDEESGGDLPPVTLIDDEIPLVPATDHSTPPPPPLVLPIFVEVDKPEDVTKVPLFDFYPVTIEPLPVIDIAPVVTSEPEDTDVPFVIVEVSASPEGGMSAFYKFISSKVKYPSQANRMGIEGRVYVEFIIERDGSLTDVKTVEGRGIGGGCDEEAVRAVKACPKWNPAKQRGKVVRQKMILPIIFQLQRN